MVAFRGQLNGLLFVVVYTKAMWAYISSLHCCVKRSLTATVSVGGFS